ncbi:MAG: hypothetical protein HY329_19090 [Chloroflexi bacterium]|nr:hypothetical protein [Chloroflexota bacterium]
MTLPTKSARRRTAPILGGAVIALLALGCSTPPVPTPAAAPTTAAAKPATAATSAAPAAASPTTAAAVKPAAVASPAVAASPTTAAPLKPAVAAPSPTATQAAAAGGLATSRQAMSGIRSYRADIRLTQTSGTPTQGTFEFVLPDRWHATLTTEVGGNRATIETITIGTDTWVKLGPNWTKTSTGQAAAGGAVPGMPPNPADAIGAFLGGPADATRGAVASAKAGQCQIWESQANQRSVCIGLTDNLPYRYTDRTTNLEMELYDFNANITITPPA